MPIPAYMTISLVEEEELCEGACTTESIGIMAEEIVDEEMQNTIQVVGFEGLIHVPTNPNSGVPTGTRIHKGMKFTKVWDKTSPLLFQALCDGQQITNLELQFYRITDGEAENYYTITLNDAIITKIESYMPNCLDWRNEALTQLEDVWINYKAITVSHEVAGVEGADEWGGEEE
ncbi:MAG: type VI secretion system tube protein Hcp [SAR324 cluster bacterium]|nr:type VI secretion system tube protein Hcp [SAR324 cluster bacterium]